MSLRYKLSVKKEQDLYNMEELRVAFSFVYEHFIYSQKHAEGGFPLYKEAN